MDVEMGPELEPENSQQQQTDEFKDLNAPKGAWAGEVVQGTVELVGNVAVAAMDAEIYGSVLDSTLELGGEVLEGLGEIISAIGDGV